ncbi:protein kinase [Actinomadura luteofluorescens]|uniref:protein kinase domain-containing protein n=1 Tax=Actinomadura luteofluorescens TaxID=46163 RepID=UPI00362615D6
MYPRRFGPYELLCELGEGGMGAVHLGRAPDGRIVAVKTMKGLVDQSEEGRRRFEREITALRKVDAPNVAAFVDADITAPTPYLVTEYVQGRSLDAVMADGPLGTEDLGRAGARAGPRSRRRPRGRAGPPGRQTGQHRHRGR